MDINNILVPIDFSRFSDAALDYAASLARAKDANLHIVHVKEPFHIYDADTRFGDVVPYSDLDTLKHALEKVQPQDGNVACKHWLITGEPIKGILELAAQENVDLIVMGSHGRRGVMRMLMGSVAEGVLRKAKCPVLTVKHHRPEKAEDDPIPATSMSR